MFEDSKAEHFIDAILLNALANCFKPGDTYLTENQLFLRGFAPLEAYCRSLIDRLASRNLVELKPSNESQFGQVSGSSRSVRLLVDNRNRDAHAHTSDRLELIISIFRDSTDCDLALAALRRVVSAHECIEFAEYFVNKAGFKLINAFAENQKLHLLIFQEHVGIVYNLLWRAIRNRSRKMIRGDALEFAQIIDYVFELYSRSKRRGMRLDVFQRPADLKCSVLSKFIERRSSTKNIV